MSLSTSAATAAFGIAAGAGAGVLALTAVVALQRGDLSGFEWAERYGVLAIVAVIAFVLLKQNERHARRRDEALTQYVAVMDRQVDVMRDIAREIRASNEGHHQISERIDRALETSLRVRAEADAALLRRLDQVASKPPAT